jgi:exopolysaccharide biosynthesis predicted pyruvyltransferase EpsI
MSRAEGNPVGIQTRQLLAVFGDLPRRHVSFVEPGGNFGDYLIWKGAYKTAELAQVPYAVVSYEQLMQRRTGPDDVIYIHGGGGFVPWWSGKPMKMLAKLSAEFRGTLILGPTTFSDDEAYIREVFRNCFHGASFKRFFLFAREKTSFDLVKKTTSLPCRTEIILEHDTAFNLLREDVLADDVERSGHVCYAIRHDKERPEGQGFNYLSWIDPIDISDTFEQWVRFHARSNALVTNRTHSAILGAILGIPTTMLPNGYHKNRSIWEHSLSERGVQWRESIDCPRINRTIERDDLLRSIFTSRKYRKLLKIKQDWMG